MDERKDVTARIGELAGLFDELRLKAHLLGREGQDLLAKLERQLTEAEHRLQRKSGLDQDLALVLHELHEALGRLRERAAARESQS
jgi:septal ring factor EnvC (AmiA/AmiB activator)